MKKGDETAAEKRGIQSVEAAIAILQAVASAGGPQPLSAIAKATGNAASTTHRYLISLRRGELVRQDPLTGGYDLGPGALHLGSAALRRMDAVGVAQNEAMRLATNCGETCFVSIWMADGPMIIRWFQGRRPIITSAGIGSVLPVMLSSSGQMFAAHLPPHAIEAALAASTPAHTLASVKKTLDKVRENRFSWIDGLIVSGLRGMSVPVLDVQGNIQCALTMLSTELSLVKFPNEPQRQLVKAGKEASRQLGYSDD